MAMKRSSAFIPPLPSTTYPPPPPLYLDPDIQSQLVSIVSRLEKLFPFLCAEISKPINNDCEKSTEIHGENSLVHPEEADDMEPEAMEIGAESIEKISPEMTNLKFEANMGENGNPRSTPTSEVTTMASLNVSKNTGQSNNQKTSQNSNKQQQGPSSADPTSGSWEVERQPRRGKELCFCCGNKFESGHHCKLSTFTMLEVMEEPFVPSFNLEDNGSGAIT